MDLDEMKNGIIATVEEKLTDLPCNVYFGSAATIAGVAVAFRLFGKKSQSRFFGQWIAPFILLGVYSKLKKSAQKHREDANG